MSESHFPLWLEAVLQSSIMRVKSLQLQLMPTVNLLIQSAPPQRRIRIEKGQIITYSIPHALKVQQHVLFQRFNHLTQFSLSGFSLSRLARSLGHSCGWFESGQHSTRALFPVGWHSLPYLCDTAMRKHSHCLPWRDNYFQLKHQTIKYLFCLSAGYNYTSEFRPVSSSSEAQHFTLPVYSAPRLASLQAAFKSHVPWTLSPIISNMILTNRF